MSHSSPVKWMRLVGTAGSAPHTYQDLGPRPLRGFLRRELQAVQREHSLDACKIKMVSAENFEVAELISQAQFMVRLELVSMAGSADTLKVLATVWIASFQSSYEPRRHNVVHMAAYSNLLEIYSTRLHLALPAQRRCPPFPPSFPRWLSPWPL